MADLFASGRIIDAIIALLLLEMLALGLFVKATSRGPTLRSIMFNSLAGMSLLLAVKTALSQAPWYWTGAALAASLLMHLGDLYDRWTTAAR